jgi:hypothetical protein
VAGRAGEARRQSRRPIRLRHQLCAAAKRPAADESELFTVLQGWETRPFDFRHAWDTANAQ